MNLVHFARVFGVAGGVPALDVAQNGRRHG